MIQRYLKDELEKIIPDLSWTADFYTAQDNTGTVYNEGGGLPDVYESEMRYPTYMVYIRSSEWYFAETAAQKVYKDFHRKEDFIAGVNEYDKNGNVTGTKTYHVYFMSAVSDPNRIGVQDNIMDYSVNFDVVLREMKEE